MIIDAHTHLFPPGVVLDREGHRARDIWFGEAFASPKAIFVTPEELLASMDGAGIEYSVVVGWPWRDPGLCAEHNAYLAEVSAQSGGRLQWMAIVNPTSRNSRNQVIDASAAGAVAIGELNADGQDFDWRDVGVLEPFVESCLEVGLPIMMHCSESVGHLYPGKGSATPEKIVPFAEAYPELKIIAAHWGGGLPYYELMPEVRRALQNVVYDSAASTYLYDFAIFDAVTRIAGADRVLFASDFPVLKQKRFLDRVRMTGLDDETMKKVLGGNAQRVFGLAEEE